MNVDLIDLAAVSFGLIALLFAYANTRKNGDGFVAVGSFIVALVAFSWAYWN